MEEIKESVISFIAGVKDRVKKGSAELASSLHDIQDELNDDLENLSKELDGNGTDHRI